MKISNDPISDMLTRIRNAMAIGMPEVEIPYSKMKHGIAALLEKEGYVGKVTRDDSEKHLKLRVGLKYQDDKSPAIHKIKRVSRPGLRVYKKSTELPVVLNHIGIAVVSTSQGLMTNKDAKKSGVGGEIICEVY